jgi:hypothetical protein
LLTFDRDAYEEFSEIISQGYELLLDFQAYVEEAENPVNNAYREDAIVKAFSSARDLQRNEERWEYLLENIPASGIETVEDLIIKTEKHGDRLQIFDLEFDGEGPDEIEMAAINAVSDNYSILQEYDLINYDRDFETGFGNKNLNITV